MSSFVAMTIHITYHRNRLDYK